MIRVITIRTVMIKIIFLINNLNFACEGYHCVHMAYGDTKGGAYEKREKRYQAAFAFDGDIAYSYFIRFYSDLWSDAGVSFLLRQYPG